MATATKPKRKTAGSKAAGSKAELYRTVKIEADGSRPGGHVLLGVAQDANGMYYGGHGVYWSPSTRDLKTQALSMTPGNSRLWGTIKLAVMQAQQDALAQVERLWMCKLNEDQFAQVQRLQSAIQTFDVDRWVDVLEAAQDVDVIDVSAETLSVDSGARCATVDLPLEKIHRRPSNRGGAPVEFPDVADLVASIEAFGLSTPIEVRDRSAEQDLPIGHYELVKGERRWTAFRALDRPTIPATIRTGLGEQAAAVQAAIDNTHRVGLDPIQRARSIESSVAAGLTLEQAAKAHGLSESAGKNAVRLLELPPKLQTAVAGGEVPERTARYLVPYAKLGAVMKQAEKALLGKNTAWWAEPGREEGTVKNGVRRLVDECTRPLDGSKHDYGYQKGQHPCYFEKELTPELRQKLGATEIRIDNKPVLVATNVDEFDQLNFAKLAERENAKQAKKEKLAAKAKTNGQVANPAAEAQQDDTLARNLRQWVHQFRRLLIADALVPGDVRTRKLAWWVLDSLVQGWQCAPLADWSEAVGVYRGLLQPGAWSDHSEMLDVMFRTADDVDQAECLRTRFLLWPQWRQWPNQPGVVLASDAMDGLLAGPDELPEKFPSLDDGDEVLKAKQDWLIACGVQPDWYCSMGEGWRRCREPGVYRQMLQKLIGFHNRRQLLRFADELGVREEIERHKKLADQQAALLACHAGSDSLKPPAFVCEPAAAAKRKR